MTTARSRKPIVLRKQRFYPHPVDQVWAALTTPDAIAQWLMPNNFPVDAAPGREFEFRVDPMGPIGGIVKCRILELERPDARATRARMVWSWTQSGPGRIADAAMRIEWVLESHEGGTRLTFIQSGLEAMPWLFRRMMTFGWGTMINRWLPTVLKAFERSPDGKLRYHRIAKAPNRGHHKTRTVPENFAK